MQYRNRTDSKIIAFADAEYYLNRREDAEHGKQKLSGVMALILGIVLTIELMVMGGMLFKIDFHSTDHIALLLVFVVLYFGVVAGLTDK